VGLLQPDPARRIASADEALAWLMRCPPWPPGATALRELYTRCVGVARRTGFTDPEIVRALGPAPSGPVPLRVPAAPSRPELTATLQRRVQVPSWTPTPSLTPSLGTEPVRPIAPDAVILRHRSAPRPYRRGGSAAGLRWLGRGLWLLAGVLAVIAAGLAIAPSPVRSSACIEEAPVPPAQRAWLRLRSDGQPRAQVRIDMQILSVAARTACWLAPGAHELAWRGSPEEAWHHVGSHTLVSAKEHLVRVGDDGLAITAYDP
jgi:hypothetical protein